MMDVKIANKLAQLRRDNNLSQEELAERLGLSRQAVSKWERAEASPDTDNLIALARLYGVSLDSLLELDTSPDEQEESGASKEDPDDPDDPDDDGDDEDGDGDSSYTHVDIGHGGIHVEAPSATVRINGSGIYVDDRENGENVDIPWSKIHDKAHKVRRAVWHKLPVPIIVTIAYILLGFFLNLWHPGWLLFFIIPLYYSLVSAITNRRANNFAYPVLAAGAYLLIGFLFGLWHPGWVIFLTIPIYYSIAGMFSHSPKITCDCKIDDTPDVSE